MKVLMNQRTRFHRERVSGNIEYSERVTWQPKHKSPLHICVYQLPLSIRVYISLWKTLSSQLRFTARDTPIFQKIMNYIKIAFLLGKHTPGFRCNIHNTYLSSYIYIYTFLFNYSVYFSFLFIFMFYLYWYLYLCFIHIYMYMQYSHIYVYMFIYNIIYIFIVFLSEKQAVWLNVAVAVQGVLNFTGQDLRLKKCCRSSKLPYTQAPCSCLESPNPQPYMPPGI